MNFTFIFDKFVLHESETITNFGKTISWQLASVCRVNQYVRMPRAFKKLSVDLINIESCLAQLSDAVDLSRQFSEICEEIMSDSTFYIHIAYERFGHEKWDCIVKISTEFFFSFIRGLANVNKCHLFLQDRFLNSIGHTILAKMCLTCTDSVKNILPS